MGFAGLVGNEALGYHLDAKQKKGAIEGTEV